MFYLIALLCLILLRPHHQPPSFLYLQPRLLHVPLQLSDFPLQLLHFLLDFSRQLSYKHFPLQLVSVCLPSFSLQNLSTVSSNTSTVTRIYQCIVLIPQILIIYQLSFLHHFISLWTTDTDIWQYFCVKELGHDLNI